MGPTGEPPIPTYDSPLLMGREEAPVSSRCEGRAEARATRGLGASDPDGAMRAVWPLMALPFAALRVAWSEAASFDMA